MTETSPSSNNSGRSIVRTLRWSVERLMTPFLVLAVGVLLIVAVGVAQRIGWISAGASTTSKAEAASTSDYTCPMHPQIRQPTTGRCPICGMELVPANAGGGDLDAMSVKIEPAQRRLANIQTAEVRFEPLFDDVKTIGAIAIDESRMATIASYIDGRIERLFADYTGVQVSKADHLAVVYSGELHSAQVEYLENRRALSTNSSSLSAVRQAQEKFVVNARRKLQELGLQEAQIRELENSGKAQSRQTIYAPMGGTVIEKLAVEGKYVKAGEPIYRIADLSTVWLKLDLYPEDASRIRFGQVVDARLTSIPGVTLQGRVAFIDPTVNEKRRTVGVRVEFLNEDGKLRPGDYANATIRIPIGQEGEVYDSQLAGKWISPMHPQIIREAPGQCPICGMDLVSTGRYGYAAEPVEQPASLFVPRSAVLMAADNSVVYVETEPGRFQIRKVTLGPLLRDKVAIVDGLEAGEHVATSGNFLIDSQMQLAGNPSLIDPTRAMTQRERKKPLDFPNVHMSELAGTAGEQLELLYAAYFRIQRALTLDEKPSEKDATTLHGLATVLSNDPAIVKDLQKLVADVAKHSEHLHHLDLEKARHDAFRPMSHAIIRLAASVRGENAVSDFHQMFCPMVKGGSGDWLQPDKELLNPYYGSQMLECGEVVRAFPSSGREMASEEAGESAPLNHEHGGGN